jgi:integrase
VFGLRGKISFTEISQPWLREIAKRWAEDDLPKHRGRQAANVAKRTVVTIVGLSTSLRLSRDDRGDDPAALSRRDILTFTNRLAHQQRTGAISELQRLTAARDARRFLVDIRALGLTRPGGPAAGLPDDFLFNRSDIPPQPHEDRAGRDLPAWVLRVINDNLPVLEARSGVDCRRMVELLIDTGRRPDEICRLSFDCLTRDGDGKPVLIYTDSKNHKPGRRLPIAEATASIIADQQAEVRQRFPGTSLNELVLFPRDRKNPRGTEPNVEQVFTNAHRQFVNAIADKLTTTVTGPDGQRRTEVFDRLAVIPYAYRHSYAQRHADEGVPPDVLRDLMGHDSVQTTVGYYRVTEKRVRTAIDRVSAHQFDGQGRRVFHNIQGLLAHEHARMRVGQVAVPFGICTEPSNVKAGGQACPYKFTCLGCGHFRSDPSYLPELKSYLQQLLADRERIQAATDLQDWARQQLTPRDEEINQLRQLIRRVEDDVADLSEADQAQIAEAVSVIRKTRQVVNLGLPSIQPRTAKLG